MYEILVWLPFLYYNVGCLTNLTKSDVIIPSLARLGIIIARLGCAGEKILKLTGVCVVCILGIEEYLNPN